MIIQEREGKSMKTVQRRQRLISLIREQKRVSLHEIKESFDGSTMTLHRDLAVIEAQGLIRRYFGGVVSTENVTPEFAPADALGYMSGRTNPVTSRSAYMTTFTDGQQSVSCCPVSGLKIHLGHNGNIASAAATDLVSCRLVPAESAYFLIGSNAEPCCSPSILAFADIEQARRFQTGFGGFLGTLEETMVRLRHSTLSATHSLHLPVIRAAASRVVKPESSGQRHNIKKGASHEK
jgi:hypothetical protein